METTITNEKIEQLEKNHLTQMELNISLQKVIEVQNEFLYSLKEKMDLQSKRIDKLYR